MLHIAIVESAGIAKELVFQIGKILHEYAWNFEHFTSVVDFFKMEQTTPYDLVFLHEKFKTPRIYETLIKDKPYTVIFTCEQKEELQLSSTVYQVDRHHIEHEKSSLEHILLPIVKRQEDFFFSYNDVKIMMKISDIHYIEKQDKYLIYHTVKGEFRQRGNMSETAARFEEYGFLHVHVSFLVNEIFLDGLEGDEVVLKNGEQLPISRSRAKNVKAYFKKKKLNIRA